MARITAVPQATGHPELRQRDLSIATVSGYRHLGCYSDNTDRILTATSTYPVVRNDPDYCCEWCRFLNPDFRFCGLENGDNCYCDSATAYDITTEPASKCNSQCPGKGNAACGDYFYMNLYTMTAAAHTVTKIESPKVGKVNGYSYLGCYTDHDDRVLAGPQITPGVLDPQFCCDWCAHQDGGYQICGVEFGNQCYCDSTTTNALRATAADCSQSCIGYDNLQCGGLYRLNMYSATGAAITSVVQSKTKGPNTASATSTNSAEADTGSGGGSSTLSGGAIAGIVIGAIAAVALVAAFLFRRRLAGLCGKQHGGPSQLDGTQIGGGHGPHEFKNEPQYHPTGNEGGYEMIHTSEMDGNSPQRPAELGS